MTQALFSHNTNPPSVVEVELDLDAGILILRLYEGSVYLASGPLHFTDANGEGGDVLFTNFTSPDNVNFFYPLPSLLSHSFKLVPPPINMSLPEGLFRDSSGTTSEQQTGLQVNILPDSTPPRIVAFTFDLNTGSLLITFDEPVNQESINPTTGLYLTSNFQGTNDSVVVMADEISATNLNTELSIVVNTITTLNSIKFDETICTAVHNCFLGVSSTFLADVSDNIILASLSNTIAENFIVDHTQPELVSYTINLDTSSVVFTFNEPIDAVSFNPAGITLDIHPDEIEISGDDLTQYQPVSLEGASNVINHANQSTVITLRLETPALVSLKLLVTNVNVTCTMEDFTAQDYSSNNVVSIPSTTPFPPSLIVLDQSPPELQEFIAGYPDSQQLIFVFNEPVELSSWNTSALVLSLLTTGSTPREYIFSDGEVERNEDVNSVTFTIGNSEYMFSMLEEHYRNAYINGLIGITTTSTLVDDLFGNPLEPLTEPLLFNATIPDETPELLATDFDLNTGTLVLTFSNIVYASFSAGKIRFQDDAESPSYTITLANNGTFTRTIPTTISLTLHNDDLNELKINPFLATSLVNTFVYLSEGFARDAGSVPIREQNATQVSRFIPDTKRPDVTRFDLDLDSNILSIQFNEPVITSTFDETSIALINSTSHPLSDNSRVYISSVYPLVQGNVTSIRALFSEDDAIHIKRLPLCYTTSNCFVIFEEALATDVSGNVFLPSAGPMQVSTVSPDVTPPQLLFFPLFDIDSGLFTLIFSEPINGSSTDYTIVEFHNSPTDSNTSLTLTEGFTSPDHIQVDFHLSTGDLNQIKSNLELCTYVDNCWIRLPSFFVTDIGMNPFIHSLYESDVAASYHQPAVFISDKTPPTLDKATMDLNEGVLTLSFSEVIVEATFLPSDITLLQYPSSSVSITLSPLSSVSFTSYGAEVAIQLTYTDLNWLKANNLFTSSDNSYLSLVSDLVDVSGNRFQDIPPNEGFQVEDIVPDQTQPRMVSFDYFDLESNYFVVLFDEPVDVATLQATQVMLASQASDDASTYNLTSAASVLAVDESLLSIAVTLTRSDRVNIKLISSLATVRGNTYIFLGNSAVEDLSGNANLGMHITQAIQLSPGGFSEDISPANLVEFQLDLNTALLSLTFDDVIDSTSINPMSLTLQNKPSSPTSYIALISSSTQSNENSDLIYISLSKRELLRLKLDLTLATSAVDCYTSMDSSFATDIENRPVVAIPSSFALPLLPLSYIPDTTAPSLSTFALDLDSGTLQLNFSEPVLPHFTNSSQLTLHSQSSGMGTFITLNSTTSLLTTANASLTVELQLLQCDLNFVKNASDLGIDTGTTYISLTTYFITDVSGNSIASILPNNSIVAIDFIIDSTPPQLFGFEADLTPEAKLYLTFSETVRLKGDIQGSVSLLNAAVGAMIVIQLTDADESEQTGFSEVQITLSPAVITRLLVDTIASSVDSLYLSLTTGVVEDTTGNHVIPVSAFKVQQLCKFSVTVQI